MLLIRTITEDQLWNSSPKVVALQVPPIASAAKVVLLYEDFEAELPALAAALEFDPKRAPYIDFERMVVGWLTRDA